MSFGIMFPIHTEEVLAKMAASLTPGAPVSFTFWRKFGIWAVMHKAAICATCDTTHPEPRFYHPKWAHSETLVSYLEHAGFKDITVTEENIPWKVESKSAFVKYVKSLPMWKDYIKDWSLEQQEKLVDCALEVLDEEYPDAGHGPIEIPMMGFIAVAKRGP